MIRLVTTAANSSRETKIRATISLRRRYHLVVGEQPLQVLDIPRPHNEAALVVVCLNEVVCLEQSTWAVTACVYAIAGSSAGTLKRVRLRVAGTLLSVPLGLLFLSVAGHLPLILWVVAALAMVVYAIALPERYDIACGAYAFTLLMTLAAIGERSTALFAARAWETVLGGSIGVAAVLLVLPLRSMSGGDFSAGRP